MCVQELKEKYTQAKALGSRANELRVTMASLKQQLEQRRMQRAAADIAAGGTGAAAADAGDEDAGALAELGEQRAEYKAAFDSLRERKQDIERLQGLLERSRQQMAVRQAMSLCIVLQYGWIHWRAKLLLRVFVRTGAGTSPRLLLSAALENMPAALWWHWQTCGLGCDSDESSFFVGRLFVYDHVQAVT